jgi:hypothetical protein
MPQGKAELLDLFQANRISKPSSGFHPPVMPTSSFTCGVREQDLLA